MESGHRRLARHPSLEERFDPAVRICPSDPLWAADAQTELRLIEDELGPVAIRVEHVGSTAVPGLAAKPIVDLQLTVVQVEPRELYVDGLERLGYSFIANPNSPDFHLFAKPLQRPRSHHLHVCGLGSEHEFRHLAVRDFLRANGDEAAKYEAVKREVAERHPQDRLAYIAGKESCVDQLEIRAVAWATHSDGLQLRV